MVFKRLNNMNIKKCLLDLVVRKFFYSWFSKIKREDFDYSELKIEGRDSFLMIFLDYYLKLILWV